MGVIGEIIKGAGSVAQLGIGIGQTIAGIVQKKPPLPEYDIPQEIYDNMSEAEYQSFMGLPDAQKQQFIEQSQRAGATALRSSAERKGGLGLVSSIAQQERDATMSLLSMDAEQRMKNIQNLWRMREVKASEERTRQQVKRENIVEERARINEMRGAGLQNIMGALGTASGQETMAPGTFDWLSKLKTPGSAAPGSITPDPIKLSTTQKSTEFPQQRSLADLL